MSEGERLDELHTSQCLTDGAIPTMAESFTRNPTQEGRSSSASSSGGNENRTGHDCDVSPTPQTASLDLNSTNGTVSAGSHPSFPVSISGGGRVMTTNAALESSWLVCLYAVCLQGDPRILFCIVLGSAEIPNNDYRFHAQLRDLPKSKKKVFFPDREMLIAEMWKRHRTLRKKGEPRGFLPLNGSNGDIADWLSKNPWPMTDAESSYFGHELKVLIKLVVKDCSIPNGTDRLAEPFMTAQHERLDVAANQRRLLASFARSQLETRGVAACLSGLYAQLLEEEEGETTTGKGAMSLNQDKTNLARQSLDKRKEEEEENEKEKELAVRLGVDSLQCRLAQHTALVQQLDDHNHQKSSNNNTVSWKNNAAAAATVQQLRVQIQLIQDEIRRVLLHNKNNNNNNTNDA